jgi:hypothetical protein
MLDNNPLSYHIGHDGFIWFIGVVENTSDDSLKIGRVKARIIGWHTNELSTDDLPWAYPIQPVTDSTATHNIKPGDWVFGFFLDGKLGQQPMILGVFPSIPQPFTNTLTNAARIAAVIV